MRTRGVLTAEAQSTLLMAVPGARPQPPASLTQEQAAEWRAIVARMPQDHFTAEMFPLLAHLCCHICVSRELGKILPSLRTGSDEELEKFERVTKMHTDAGKAIANLSTKLRLTPQSRAGSTRSGLAKIRNEPAEKPWGVVAEPEGPA